MGLLGSFLRRVTRLFRHPAQAPASITVVIPTYNRGARLDRAIDSAFAQALPGIDVHVFDNASTDDTETRVRRRIEAGQAVSYTRHPSNGGPIANFQSALAGVRSEFFVPLADDDWLVPGFLARALALMQADNRLGAVIFTTTAFDEQGNVLDVYPQRLDLRRKGRLEPAEHLQEWLRFGHYHWSSVLWRRSVLETAGAPYLHAGLPSDVDFQLRVFAHWPVMLVDAAGAGYLIHGGQYGGALSIDNLPDWARIFRTLDRIVSEAGLVPPALYSELRRIMRDRYAPIWRRGTPPSEVDALRGLILAAALDLEDWEFAYQLAGRMAPLACDGALPGPPHWAEARSPAELAFDRTLLDAARRAIPR